VTELSVLERVRAAVAEAGYDPRLIVAARPSLHDDAIFAWRKGALPEAIVWRARESVAVRLPRCLACWLAETALRGPNVCLADRRFVEDCGRDRTDP
jgi:hypothetical protein